MSVATRLQEVGLAAPPARTVEVVAARSVAEGALRALLRVGPEALERPWRWRGRDVSVRYGFYRCYELLEAALAAVEGVSSRRAEGARIVGPAVGAQWDLHGLLLPLDEADVDRAPAGEWSIRQTLAHVLYAQERFTTGAAWAVHRVRAGGDLPLVPETWRGSGAGVAPPLAGSLAEVRRALDDALDACAGLFATVDDEPALAATATWSGYEVPVRFRLGRLAGHLREHTIQVEKTLVLLERWPSEVERMVRTIAGAYGRLEGACLGVAPTPDALTRAVGDVERHAREVVAAAA
jgi:hypothetical protein